VHCDDSWWTRSQRIRTLVEGLFEVALVGPAAVPRYQQLAQAAVDLRQQGLSYRGIGAQLGMDDKMVRKAGPDPPWA